MKEKIVASSGNVFADPGFDQAEAAILHEPHTPLLRGSHTMPNRYGAKARSDSISFDANVDCLDQAQKAASGLSDLPEHSLTQPLKQRQRSNWLAENQDAIRAYNQLVEDVGAFGDTARRF